MDCPNWFFVQNSNFELHHQPKFREFQATKMEINVVIG